jgi:outer membrane receptor protein involved in Fe transport
MAMPKGAVLAVLVLVAAGSTVSRTAAQQPVQVAFADPQPHFVAAWAPKKERAAEHAAVLVRRVSLELTNVSLDAALKALTNRAGLRITYSPAVLPADRRVTISARDVAVVAALTEMLFRSGLDVVVGRDGALALVRCGHERGEGEVVDSGVIVGRVTDKSTGNPIAGASVTVEGGRGSTTTDAEGRFRITGLEIGTYEVRTRYIGYTPIAVSVTVSAVGEAMADFALAKSVQKLDELVTVTPGGSQTQLKALPTPVTVISAQDIAERRPQALLDVIRQAVPTGVAFDNPVVPVQTSFSVRGASSLSPDGSSMKIFIDGVEATRFAASPVDPNSIERIEVLRGPQASTLYGADAAGGVVQIFTKRGGAEESRPTVEAQAQVGIQQTPYTDFGGVLRQNYNGSVHGGGPDVSYNFGGGYARLSDYVPNGDLSRQVTPSIYGGMRFGRGIFAADISARYFRNKLPLVVSPQALSSGFIPNSRPNYQVQDYTNETYGTKISVVPTNWWRNIIMLGVDRSGTTATQTQRRLTTPADTFFALTNNTSRKISVGFNSSASGRLSDILTGTITVGIDHYDQDAHSFNTTRALNTEGTIQIAGSANQSRGVKSNTGYFAQAEAGWHDIAFLTIGLRAENNSSFGRDIGTPVLPRAGLSVAQRFGRATMKARGSYGRAIRTPAVGQSFGVITPFAIQLENTRLSPERQQGWDAGVDLVVEGLGSLSVTGYNQIAEDLISTVTTSASPVFTYQFQNIGRVANSGVEIEGTIGIRPFQLRAQYGYVRSVIEDLGLAVSPEADLQVGDQPTLIPKHTGGAVVSLAPLEGATVSAGLTYVGGYRNYDFLAVNRCLGGTGPCPDSFVTTGSTKEFLVEYPSFAKFNVSITQRLTHQLEASLAIDNLTNNQAYEGGSLLPIMGRLTMLGLHVTY